MNSSDKLEKKLAEIRSRFLGEPVYSKNKYIESFCLFISRWQYALTRGLYLKVKYFIQRHTRGFDDLDKWNAAWYIARKAVPVLTAWRNSRIMGTGIKRHIESRHGEIIELSDDEYLNSDDCPAAFTPEEWKAIIDDIIFAFNFVLDADSIYSEPLDRETEILLRKRYKRGMKLLGIYFTSLWD